MRFGSQTKDIRSLTGLRGIAAIYVVFHHYLSLGLFGSPIATFFNHGYLAVDLFFVLSGFVMTMSYQHMFEHELSFEKYRTFIGRRIARIYPIYIIATVASMMLILLGLNYAIGDTPVPSGKLFGTFIVNCLLIQSWGLAPSLNDPAWSLSAEWAAYFLFPALLALCLFRHALLAWAVGLLSISMITALCLMQLHGVRFAPQALLDIPSYRYGLAVIRCIPEFCLGILAFRASFTPFGHRLRSSGAASATLGLLTIVLLFIPKTDLLTVMLFPLLIVSLAAGALHLPGRILSTATADYLGKLSYTIYLIHPICGSVIVPVAAEMARHGHRHGHSFGVIAAVALTFFLSILSYTFIEVPSRGVLRKLFEGDIRRIPAPLISIPNKEGG